VTGSGAVSIPEPPALGLPPLTGRFEIAENQLQKRTFYRVTMYSPVGGVVTYNGVGDCPLNLTLGGDAIQSQICFGPAALQICPGLVAFSSCNGVADTAGLYCP
jgi:hypothetical protein